MGARIRFRDAQTVDWDVKQLKEILVEYAG
jgi:hypothetical protein